MTKSQELALVKRVMAVSGGMEGNPMYWPMIAEATGCSEADVVEIEMLMRDEVFHSTLDWQTRAQFTRGAKQAFAMLKAMRNGRVDR